MDYMLGKRESPTLMDREVHDVAHAANVLTGRGDIGFLKDHAATAGALLWSPRLQAARMQMLALPFAKTPAARMAAAKSFVTVMAGGTAFLMALRATGVADVNLDPGSTDFGKAKIGDTRIDVWGGMLPYARTFYRVLAGRRSTEFGREITAEPGIGGRVMFAASELQRFGESKLAATPGAVLALTRGRTYAGQDIYEDPVAARRWLAEQFTPLGAKSIYDAWQKEGPAVGAALTGPALLGVGINTYQNDPYRQYQAGADPLVPKTMMHSWSVYKSLNQRDKKAYIEVHPELEPLVDVEEALRGALRQAHPEIETRLVKRGYSPKTPQGEAAVLKTQMQNIAK
jgi:hypothetical protein